MKHKTSAKNSQRLKQKHKNKEPQNTKAWKL